MDFEKPIETLADAKRYFQSMGCSHFHMAREYPNRYAEYRALGVDRDEEVQWTAETVSSLIDRLCSPDTDRHELWNVHSRLTDLVLQYRFNDSLERMLAVTKTIEPRLLKRDRLLVAETIVGRQALVRYRPGLERFAVGLRTALVSAPPLTPIPLK